MYIVAIQNFKISAKKLSYAAKYCVKRLLSYFYQVTVKDKSAIPDNFIKKLFYNTIWSEYAWQTSDKNTFLICLFIFYGVNNN